MGWAGVVYSELLRKAERAFDAFVTLDRGIWHQQHMERLDLAVFVLTSPGNRASDLLPPAEPLWSALSFAVPGRLGHIG